MRTSQNTKGPGKKKNGPRLFATYMQEKLAVTVMVITLALFALIVVLYQLIKNNQEDYTKIVLSQQSYDSRVIPFKRGNIVDRNGTYLATSEKVYNLILDPAQINDDPERYLEPTVAALSEVFGYDAQELRTIFNERADSAYVRYDRRLSYEQKKAFEDVKEERNNAFKEANSRQRVWGVWFEDEYRRVYPFNDLACNVIGFASADSAGGTGGIEQFYNDQLIGINGREYGYLNEETNLERVIKPASNGNTIVSTIDVNIQQIAEKYIDEWESTTGSNMSAALVMNPQNGEILAMTNKNRFDLNNPRDLTGRYTDAEIRQLGLEEAAEDYHRKNPDKAKITPAQVSRYYSDSEIEAFGKMVAWNQIWRNFCVSDTYEPGSPQKIFTIAAALEEGVIKGDESFLCDGYQHVGGYDIHCVNRFGHGSLTVEESLMQSCNDALMQIASMMGRDRFADYQSIFGFGRKTGIDLPGEADAASLVYSAENMDPASLASNSFGQNYNCTMVQMAAAYCSVINGGSYYEPHVVKQVLNEQGSLVKKVEPNLVRETVSEPTTAFIRKALLRTVNEATGRAAKVEGYEVGGKTGTAQKHPREERDYLVSFIGFAPANDPQVLVYVIVDVPHVEKAEQPHSTYAANIVQKIMKDSLPYLNVFPATELEISEEIEELLPQEEGISGGGSLLSEETETETETVQETKVYDSEEYVSPEGEGPSPEESAEGESEEETQESSTEESSAQGGSRQSGGRTTGSGVLSGTSLPSNRPGQSQSQTSAIHLPSGSTQAGSAENPNGIGGQGTVPGQSQDSGTQGSSPGGVQGSSAQFPQTAPVILGSPVPGESPSVGGVSGSNAGEGRVVP